GAGHRHRAGRTLGRRELGAAAVPYLVPARGHPGRGGAGPHGTGAPGSGRSQARSSAMSAAESVAPSPSAVQPVGEFAALAEYATTAEVLAAAAALRALAPRHLLDLVPAERTLLLVGAAPRDVEVLVRQLRQLPAAASEETAPEQREIPVVYDGEDLEDVAA